LNPPNPDIEPSNKDKAGSAQGSSFVGIPHFPSDDFVFLCVCIPKTLIFILPACCGSELQSSTTPLYIPRSFSDSGCIECREFFIITILILRNYYLNYSSYLIFVKAFLVYY
jgi:hypothetical protein